MTTYLKTHQTCRQDNAWMVEMVIIVWFDDVLKLYITNVPKDIIPRLILNRFESHMLGLVVIRIQQELESR